MSTERLECSGMVLNVMDVGEFDRRLVILTAERGKITAFARGAKRMKSTLLAGCRPFVCGRFTLLPGRDSYALVDIRIEQEFSALAETEAIYYGYYFLEFAAYFCQENIDGRGALNLCVLACRALLKRNVSAELIKHIFELRFLYMEGIGIVWDQEKGISESCRQTLAYAATCPLGKLFGFCLEASLEAEFFRCITKHKKHWLNHRFKSEEILKIMV